MEVQKIKKQSIDSFFIFVVSLIGIIYLRSGLGKVLGGEFVSGLNKTLGYFASENPNPAIKSFLLDSAVPNYVVFGNLTMWGEVVAAFLIVFSVLYYLFKKRLTKRIVLSLLVGLIIATFLNIVFWLSAGWTSSSTDSLNLMMGLIGIGAIVYISCKFKVVKK